MIEQKREPGSPPRRQERSNQLTNDEESTERELREKRAELSILTNRYDTLMSKSKAEREIQERTLEQMENFNTTIRELRQQIHQLTMERDQTMVELNQMREYSEEVLVLREQNLKLEQRMTSLCESPFINDAFQKKERIDKLLSFEKKLFCFEYQTFFGKSHGKVGQNGLMDYAVYDCCFCQFSTICVNSAAARSLPDSL